MVTIRLSRPDKKGVSLLVLIFAITILSIFGVGLAIIMYAKFRSFPYMTSSHQAQALADAGIEFALRYAKDNPGAFSSDWSSYIPSDSYKSYSFGNGQFALKYVPGCPDALYSKGTCGLATREVKVTNAGLSLGRQGNSVYLSSAITKTPIVNPVFPGDRISFTYCDPSQYPSMIGYSWIRLNSITIAATNAVTIMRIGSSKLSNIFEWVYDGACGPPCYGLPQQFAGTLLPVWDGSSDPPNASSGFTWNIKNPLDPALDHQCRPHSPTCPTDNNLGCPPYPTTGRTDATCNMGGPWRDQSFGLNWGHFVIETRGSIPIPTTFYISFDHGTAGYNTAPGYWPNPNPWITNKFIFTIDH
jgi:hypothetical protein